MDKSYCFSQFNIHNSDISSHIFTSCPPYCRGRGAAKGNRGFTLIEILIVVALIGIVSAIAIPQFADILPGMKVSTGTREVLSKMLLLRMKAISENKSYQMVFSAGGNNTQYQILVNGSVVTTATLPGSIIFGTNANEDPNGDTITCADDGVCFTDNKVTFTANGTATSGAVYLMPRDDKASGRTNRVRVISINSTGRIKAFRYKGDSWANF